MTLDQKIAMWTVEAQFRLDELIRRREAREDERAAAQLKTVHRSMAQHFRHARAELLP